MNEEKLLKAIRDVLTESPSKITLPELAEMVSMESGMKKSCAYMVLATAFDILEEREFEVELEDNEKE